MAHLYETRRMRRVHLRGHSNISKRLLIHACGLNLGSAQAVRLVFVGPAGNRWLLLVFTACFITRKIDYVPRLITIEEKLEAALDTPSGSMRTYFFRPSMK